MGEPLENIKSFGISTSAWDQNVLNEANLLPLDLLILTTNDKIIPSDLRVNHPNKKLIAYQYFGDYQIDYGTIEALDIQQSWDLNRDGLPDKNSPKWLGPINLSWELSYDSSKPYYKGKYPSYLVRYWEPSWIEAMKVIIDKKAAEGWDGLWLDVVGTNDWTSTDYLRSEVYSSSQLANLTYTSLQSINTYVKGKWPDFASTINGSSFWHFLDFKPEILSVIDGVVLEFSTFWATGNVENKYPKNSTFDDYRGTDELERIRKYNSTIPIFDWTSTTNDERIFNKIAIDLDKFNYLQHINYDHLDRTSDNNYSMIPHLITYVGNDQVDNIKADLNYRALIVGKDGDDVITGGNKNDIIIGGNLNDQINGKLGKDVVIYRGNYNDYEFHISNKIVTIKDNSLLTNDGTDTLSNIEQLIFADKKALVTSKDIKLINVLGTQSEKLYTGDSDEYKFYNLGDEQFGVETQRGIDSLTGECLLKFDEKNIHLINDIKATFDQVTGLHTDSGQMFRLYNAAFARFPDADGLKYWIGNFSSGKDDARAVASSFLVSDEFKERYGANVTNAKYVETLYDNVLGRDYDQDGYNYWLGNLNSGLETRYELLLGFAESAENKALFTDMTGFG